MSEKFPDTPQQPMEDAGFTPDLDAILQQNADAHEELRRQEELKRQEELAAERARKEAETLQRQQEQQQAWLGDQTTEDKTHRQLSMQANRVKSFQAYLNQRPAEPAEQPESGPTKMFHDRTEILPNVIANRNQYAESLQDQVDRQIASDYKITDEHLKAGDYDFNAESAIEDARAAGLHAVADRLEERVAANRKIAEDKVDNMIREQQAAETLDRSKVEKPYLDLLDRLNGKQPEASKETPKQEKAQDAPEAKDVQTAADEQPQKASRRKDRNDAKREKGEAAPATEAPEAAKATKTAETKTASKKSSRKKADKPAEAPEAAETSGEEVEQKAAARPKKRAAKPAESAVAKESESAKTGVTEAARDTEEAGKTEPEARAEQAKPTDEQLDATSKVLKFMKDRRSLSAQDLERYIGGLGSEAAEALIESLKSNGMLRSDVVQMRSGVPYYKVNTKNVSGILEKMEVERRARHAAGEVTEPAGEQGAEEQPEAGDTATETERTDQPEATETESPDEPEAEPAEQEPADTGKSKEIVLYQRRSKEVVPYNPTPKNPDDEPPTEKFDRVPTPREEEPAEDEFDLDNHTPGLRGFVKDARRRYRDFRAEDEQTGEAEPEPQRTPVVARARRTPRPEPEPEEEETSRLSLDEIRQMDRRIREEHARRTAQPQSLPQPDLYGQGTHQFSLGDAQELARRIEEDRVRREEAARIRDGREDTPDEGEDQVPTAGEADRGEGNQTSRKRRLGRRAMRSVLDFFSDEQPQQEQQRREAAEQQQRAEEVTGEDDDEEDKKDNVRRPPARRRGGGTYRRAA